MMKVNESIIIFPQYLRAKMIRIAMEMVTAMPESANAQLTISMHKIAHIMDVSTYFELSIKRTGGIPQVRNLKFGNIASF